MKEMQFEIEIHAPREKIWATLWQDRTFREWADLIDAGTYMVGDLEEGSTVQFISVEGYGVTSLVSALIPDAYVSFKHQADTQDEDSNSRDDQWTGGRESYTLMDDDSATTLTMSFDVPVELEKAMRESYPKALQKVKELSEK